MTAQPPAIGIILLLRTLAPKYICTLKELRIAIINSIARGYEKQILEVKDILVLSKK